MSGWQPIETAPTGVLLIGRRKDHSPSRPGYSAMVGVLYDLVKNAVIDEWTGRWAECSYWMPLEPPPADTLTADATLARSREEG